jgi:hypothetical protein
MPVICDEMLTALNASPSPQQEDLLHVGFDRLYKPWAAAKPGLQEGPSEGRNRAPDGRHPVPVVRRAATAERTHVSAGFGLLQQEG